MTPPSRGWTCPTRPARRRAARKHRLGLHRTRRQDLKLCPFGALQGCQPDRGLPDTRFALHYQRRGPRADAAGFPIAPLTPTADEVASGTINHALRFILPNGRMKEGVYVAPATHAGGPESTDPNATPYGVRFRLKADFDESGYTEPQKVVIKALKTHGMLLADGGEISLTLADDRTSNAKWADLGIDSNSFSDITVDQFEVVELGPEIPLTYECVRNP